MSTGTPPNSYLSKQMFTSQTNFNGGVVSQWIDARTDIERYRKSLRKCLNFIATPYGALRRRMGTEHVALANARSRLVTFQLSATTGYVIELGANYARFFANGERVDGLELVTPWDADEVFELQFVKINTLMLVTHRNHPPQRLKYETPTTWSLSPVSFDYPALKDARFDGTTLAVMPDGSSTTTITATLDIAASDPEKFSKVVPVAGAWEVAVDALAFTPSVTSYLKLQNSTDGGGTWADVDSFVATGTFTGIVASGLLRLAALEAATDTTLSSSSAVADLSRGDTVTIDASADVFEAGHVGAEFEVSHIPEVTETRISLKNSGVTEWIAVQGKWTLSTSGLWSGKITVERSKDNGTTVQAILARSGDRDRNIVENNEEGEKVLLRISYEKAGDADQNPYATLETDGGAISGRILITAVTDATTASGTVTSAINSSEATDEWREPAWNEVAGFPAAIAFHEARLWFGGTKDSPSTLWASRTDDFFNLEEGSDDDNAFHRVIATTELTNILWLFSHGSLYIGTSGEEWRGISDSDSGVITPGSFVLRRVSNTGSDPIAPILAGSSMIHVQRQGRSLFQISYDAASGSADGYIPTDLNQIAPEITIGGIKSLAYQTIRDRIVWAVTGRGKLIGLTYDRQQNITGWHVHETAGEFESVAVVHEQGSEDSVYFIVNRDGTRHIERMRRDQYEIIETDDALEAVYLDNSIVYRGAATVTIGGLDHLDGRMVEAVANGVWKKEFLVTDGEITLPETATHCVVGLPYESLMETLPISFESSDYGPSLGRFKRTSALLLRVYRSIGCEVACNTAGAFEWQSMRPEWRKIAGTDPQPTEYAAGELEDWSIPVVGAADRDARAACRSPSPSA